MTSTLPPPAPISSDLPTPPARPFLHYTDDADSWTYANPSGVFRIPKAFPALVTLDTSAAGEPLAISAFTISSGSQVAFPYAFNVAPTNDSIRVYYPVGYGGAAVGTFTYWINFTEDSPPKITLLYEPRSGGDFWIVWFAVTVDAFLDTGNGTLDFSDIRSRDLTWSGTRAEVGDGPDPVRWGRKVRFDWSDAGKASLRVGQVSIPDKLYGHGLVVTFGRNVARIDPTFAATSTYSDATRWPHQRKLIFWDGYYYAFYVSACVSSWCMGDPAIWYTSSRDGTTWSSPVEFGKVMALPGIDDSSPGFDVAQLGSLVAMAYIEYSSMGDTDYVRFISGVLDKGGISWGSEVRVSSVDRAKWSPSVAIGTNGIFWVGWVERESSGTAYRVKYARSDKPFAPGPWGAWTVKLNEPADSAANYQEALRPVALSNGTMMLLSVNKGVTPQRFRYRYYDPYADTVTDYWIYKNVNFPDNVDPARLFSVVADAKDIVHVLYQGDDSQVYHMNLNSGSPCLTAIAGASANAFPSVGLDAYKTLHAFWVGWSSSGTTVWYSSGNFATDLFCPTFSTPSRPFGEGLNPLWITAAEHPVSVAPALFTQSDGEIRFAAMPSPTDLGPIQDSPWSRPGLSPYEQYFQNLDEFVSPGNGLLVVRQVDLTLPGRGLDLSIARVYMEPMIFGTASYTPYLYESSPFAALGNGWHLDLPWIGSQYLHLGGGQAYWINWNVDTSYLLDSNGNVFENHVGEHFRLERQFIPSPRGGYIITGYVLDLPSGVRYTFDSTGWPFKMTDATGANSITFSYSWSFGVLLGMSITDAAGRTVTLEYSNGRVSTISLGGKRIVSYGYAGSALERVTDAMSRVTRFWYASGTSGWLLEGIQYPTGGRSVYTYATTPIAFGTELKGYPVTRRDVRDSSNASQWSLSFSYDAVGGRILFANATLPDGSYTEYNFQHSALFSTVTRYALPRTQLERMRIWNAPQGAPTQVDVFKGTSTTPNLSTQAVTDGWGNVIYVRDSLGHEQFLSFNSTLARNAFPGAGNVTRTKDSRLLYETFDFSGAIVPWSKSVAGSGSVELDKSTFSPTPRSLKLTTTASGSTASAWASFDAVSTDRLFVDFRFKIPWLEPLPTNYGLYEFNLRGSTGYQYRAAIRETPLGFLDLGYIDSGGNFQPCKTTSMRFDLWHRLTVEAVLTGSPTRYFNLYLDGASLKKWDPQYGDVDACVVLPAVGSGGVNQIEVKVSYSGGSATATMWVDEVKVFRSTRVTVKGLRANQMVELSDAAGSFVLQKRVNKDDSYPPLLDLLVYDLGLGRWRFFEYGALTLRVFREDGTLEYTSPFREFFGDDEYLYRAPLAASSLAPVRSGTRQFTKVYVDDSTNLPSGFSPFSTGSDPNPWKWSTNYRLLGAPHQGTDFHFSFQGFGEHGHGYTSGAFLSEFCSQKPDKYAYLIQFARFDALAYPQEIMLEFADDGTSWNHRAFWGANKIQRGADGTSERRNMGSLPYMPGRWLMFVVASGSNGVNICSNPGFVRGQNYLLWGGNASWDVSAVGNIETGQIRVSGLIVGWKVELHSPAGVLAAVATVPNGVATAALDVYSAGISAFPYRGYLQVYNEYGTLLYTSPVMDMFGGDLYSYTSPDFYSSNPKAEVRSAFLGTLASPLRGPYNPVLHMDMRRTSSSGLYALADFSLHGNHGDVVGYPNLGFGIVGNGGGFGPEEYAINYLVVPPSLSLNVSDELSISMWVWLDSNPDCDANSNTPNSRILVRKAPGPGEAGPSYALILLQDRTVRFEALIGTTYQTLTTTAQLPIGVSWTHLFFTRDASGSMKAYVNAGPPQIGPTVAGRITPTSGSLYVGGGVDRALCPNSLGTLDGVIDELLIFPRALDAEDLGILYRSQLIGQTYLVEKSFVKWEEGKARISEARVFHSGTWITTGMTYDVYGNLNSTTDAAGHTVYYEYSSFFGGAHPTKRTEAVSGTVVTSRSTYDPSRGWQLSAILPNGNRIRSAYDELGRVVNASYFESLPSSLPTSAVLYYDMETPTNEATPRMEDLSGKGNHGTITATSSALGKFGMARNFEGLSTGSGIDAGDVRSTWSGGFTISLWVNLTTLNPADAWPVAVEKGTDFEGFNIQYCPPLSCGADGQILAELHAGGSWATVTLVGSAQKDTFYHLAITYDPALASQRLKAYRNGARVDSSDVVTAQTVDTTGWSLTVGVSSDGTGRRWQGVIDEVYVFSAPLSAGEIQKLYYGALGLYAYETRQYDDVGNKVTVTDANGHKTQYLFDALGRLTERDRLDVSGAVYSKVVYGLDWRDLTTSATSDNGSLYQYTYDKLGRLTNLQYPGDSSRGWSYTDGSLTGTVTATDEVSRKRMTETWYGTGATKAVSEWNPKALNWNTTSYAYDGLGRLISVTDSNQGVTRHDYDDLGRLVRTTSPDGTAESYAYDNVGTLASKVDRAGRTTEYGYDEAGGLTRLTLRPSPTSSYVLTFQYDTMGNLLLASNGTLRAYYVRDKLGRVATEYLAVDSYNFSTSYGYDKVGNVQYVVYPDGTNVSYLYDGLDRATDVKIGGSEYAALGYRKDDLVASLTYYNGGTSALYSQSYVYDDRGRPLRTWVAKGSTNYLDLRYQWTTASDVKQITDAVAGKTETYGYDGQDRLWSATGPWGTNGASLTLAYTYDAKGNWLTKKEGTTTSYYVYDASKKDDRLCGVDTASGKTCTNAATRFTYDGLGQRATRTSGSTTTTYAFDMSGLMTKLVVGSTTNTYVYDALGRRVKATEGSTTTYFAYGGPNVLYTRVGSTQTDYVYASGLLILRKSGSSVRYVHADHLGNVRLVTYYTNQVKTEYSARYKPFGEAVVLTDNAAVKTRYTGEWLDGSGLYYLRARYYDPTIGRFVSQDPVLGALSHPQTHNRYSYVVNNPLKYTDPSGEFIPLLIIAVAFLMGAGIGAAAYHFTTPESQRTPLGYLTAGLVGGAVGAFTVVSFGLGMAAFGVGLPGGIAAGSWAAVGAGVLTGAAVGAQSYFLAAILGMATGTMSRENLNMRDFWISVGLGAGFGAVGGKYYTPESYWGYKQSPSKGPWEWRPRGVWDQVDSQDNLIYRSMYDQFGRKVTGIHMRPHYPFEGPHVHTWSRTTYIMPSGRTVYLEGTRVLEWTDVLRLLW